MITISLKLPQDLAIRLEDRARADQKPKSALVREFIERGLSDASGRPTSFHDLAKARCGKGRSGVRDLATHKRHLDGYGA